MKKILLTILLTAGITALGPRNAMAHDGRDYPYDRYDRPAYGPGERPEYPGYPPRPPRIHYGYDDRGYPPPGHRPPPPPFPGFVFFFGR